MLRHASSQQITRWPSVLKLSFQSGAITDHESIGNLLLLVPTGRQTEAMELFHTPPRDTAAAIRRRLPSVPMEFSRTIEADDINPDQLSRPGWPRPRYRHTPIPATSLITEGRLNIIASTPEDWRAVLCERRCDLCAEPLDEQYWWLFGEMIDEAPGWLLVRGCMHRRCWQATAHWCVHIRERLLDGSMCSARITAEQTTNPEVFTILDGNDTPLTAEANIIAEYRIAEQAVEAVWPFRDR
jgi:hypothetical protein